jgi:hypothetical protein
MYISLGANPVSVVVIRQIYQLKGLKGSACVAFAINYRSGIFQVW